MMTYLRKHYSFVRHDDPPKTFTQEEVNAFLAKERKEAEGKTGKILEELELLKSKTTLTAREKAELESRLEAMKTSSMSEIERARHELDTHKKTTAARLTELEATANGYKTRYEDATIVRAITDAAVANNAFAPEHVVALLRTNTRLVEVVDGDGKPTGELSPITKFEDVDAKGKPVTIELSPAEIVKRMSDIPKHQNLFKGKGTGGLGGAGGKGGGTVDVSRICQDAATYRKAKKEGIV